MYRKPRESAWKEFAKGIPQSIDPVGVEEIRKVFYAGYTSAFRDIARAQAKGEGDQIMNDLFDEIQVNRAAIDRSN